MKSQTVAGSSLLGVLALLIVLGGCTATAGSPTVALSSASLSFSGGSQVTENTDETAAQTLTTPSLSTASIDGWLYQADNDVEFIGWTVTGSTVSGTYDETYMQVGDTKLTTATYSFTGTISGPSVTLSFAGNSGSSLSGQLAGDTFSLSIPQTDGTISTEVFHPGTTAQYNSGVQTVQANVAQASAASAASAASTASVAQQQKAITDAQSAIDSAVSDLQATMSGVTTSTGYVTDSLTSIATDLAGQAAVLKTVQADAAQVSATQDGPQMCGQANLAQSDANRVQAFDNTIGFDLDKYTNASGELRKDLSSLDAAITTLATAKAELPGYEGTPAPSASSIKAVQDAGLAALTKGDAASSAAKATSADATKQAADIAASAENAGC